MSGLMKHSNWPQTMSQGGPFGSSMRWRASFAAQSASSLPTMPVWALTLMNSTHPRPSSCSSLRMARSSGRWSGLLRSEFGSRTTHWIRTAAAEARFIDRGEYLHPWPQPPAALENRNAALAYLNNAEKTRSLKRLREGLRLLNLAVNEGHQDGETALAGGLQFIRQERPDLALPWLARAVAAEPGNSLRRLHYAAALANAGKRDEAKQQALEAIRLEPMLEQAYAVMGQLEPDRAAYWRDEYRKAAPKRILP